MYSVCSLLVHEINNISLTERNKHCKIMCTLYIKMQVPGRRLSLSSSSSPWFNCHWAYDCAIGISFFLLQQPIRYAFATCTVRRCNGQKETRHEPASGVYFFFLLYHQPILLPSGSVRVRVEASSSSKNHLKKQKDTSEHWRGTEKRHKPARPTGKIHTARYCTRGEVRCSNLHRDAVQSPLVGSFSP